MIARVAIKPKPATRTKLLKKLQFKQLSEEAAKQERREWVAKCSQYNLAEYDYGTPFEWAIKDNKQYYLVSGLSDNPEYPLLGRHIVNGEVHAFPDSMLNWLQHRSSGVAEQIRWHVFSSYSAFYENWKKREISRYKETLLKQHKELRHD